MLVIVIIVMYSLFKHDIILFERNGLLVSRRLNEKEKLLVKHVHIDEILLANANLLPRMSQEYVWL